MARMVAGRAEPALTQIRLSTLQGLHERVTHLTLGQTRRLLGGTVAPVGACSSHRNPRRGGRGRVRGPLHLETQSSSQAQAKPSVSWAREQLSSSSAHGNGGGLRRGGEIAKVTQRRRINSVSPELAHLHLFQAAEVPSLQGI